MYPDDEIVDFVIYDETASIEYDVADDYAYNQKQSFWEKYNVQL